MGRIKAINEETIAEETYFPSMEFDNDISLDLVPENYEEVQLRDLGDETEYEGRPVMGPVESYTYDSDGEIKTNFRTNLYIIDDEEEEYLHIKINLKKNSDIQNNIRKGSVLYDFLGSIKELEAPGYMNNYNIIKSCNLEEFRDFINNLSFANIKVVEHQFNGGQSVYPGFRFLKVKAKMEE
jgi:hypothetical protein